MGAHRRRCACGSHQIGHEPLVARRFTQDHYRRLDTVTLAQLRLNLAQFDAEAVQLDLLIQPPEIFDIPVGPVTTKIARFVEPPRAKGIRNEALGG